MKTYTEEKRIRPDILTGAVYWSLVLILVFNILIVRICGDKALGFGIGPLFTYYLFYSFFVLSVQKAVWAMVRLRARRSQFLNAESNMKKSLRIFSVVGIFLALIVAFGAFSFTRNVFANTRGYFLYIIIAISLVFLCSQGVIRGYLQGIGYTRPIMISDLTIAITTVVSGTIISTVLYTYGLKVNNLFHVDDFSSVYGSIGIVTGLLIGSVVGFIQILVCYYFRKGEISTTIKNGAPRYLDNKNDVLTGLRTIAYLYLMPSLVCIFDEIMYMVTQNKAGSETDLIKEYGAFSGRILTLIALLTVLCCIPFIKTWNRVMARIERDELEGARDRFRKLVYFSSRLTIPVGVFIFVMADTLEVSIFGRSSAYVDGLLRIGGAVVILSTLAVFFAWLLNHMGKSLVIFINVTIGYVCHIGLLVVFLIVFKLGTLGVLLALLGSLIVFDLISMFMISKMLSYRQELVKTFVLPVVSAVAAGLIIFFINSVLVDVIGDVLTLLLGAVVFFVCYMSALVALKGIKSYELDKVPMGKLFKGIAKNVVHEDFYEE